MGSHSCRRPKPSRKCPDCQAGRRLYHSSLESLEAQLAIARQQLSQRNQELRRFRSAVTRLPLYELAARELAVTKTAGQLGGGIRSGVAAPRARCEPLPWRA